jgi:hypothetical protein
LGLTPARYRIPLWSAATDVYQQGKPQCGKYSRAYIEYALAGDLAVSEMLPMSMLAIRHDRALVEMSAVCLLTPIPNIGVYSSPASIRRR